MIPSHTLTFFLLLLCTFLNPTIAATNSICPDPGIKLLRPCAAACIGCVDARRDQLAYFLGCGDLPPNECFCRTDLFDRAKQGLSSCIANACTLGPWAADAKDAVGFYTRYCEKAGFTVIAEVTRTKDRDTPTVTGASITVVTQTSMESAVERTSTASSLTSITPSNSNSQVTSTIPTAGGSTGSTLSSGSKGMSSNNPIALGVGIGVGLPATVAAIVTCAVVLRKHWAEHK